MNIALGSLGLGLYIYTRARGVGINVFWRKVRVFAVDWHQFKPTFPLEIVWGDGRREVFTDRDNVAFNLEWFDSDDNDGTIVTDAEGRPVRVVVEALTIRRLEVGTSAPAAVPCESLTAHPV